MLIGTQKQKTLSKRVYVLTGTQKQKTPSERVYVLIGTQKQKTPSERVHVSTGTQKQKTSSERVRGVPSLLHRVQAVLPAGPDVCSALGNHGGAQHPAAQEGQKQEGLQGSLGKNGKRVLKRDALCSRLSLSVLE